MQSDDMQSDGLMQEDEKEALLSSGTCWLTSYTPFPPLVLPCSPSAFTNLDSPNSETLESSLSPSPKASAASSSLSPAAALEALQFNFLRAGEKAIVRLQQEAAATQPPYIADPPLFSPPLFSLSPPIPASPEAPAAAPSDPRLREREWRATRRRVKHQQLDVQRRQRESAAVSALQQLTQQKLCNPHHVDADEDCEIEERPAASAAGTGLGSKVSVLEAAVQRMQQLQRLYNAACEANEAKDREIEWLRSRLQLQQIPVSEQQTAVERARAVAPRCACKRPAPPCSPESEADASAVVASSDTSTFSFLCRLDSGAALSAYIRPLVSLLLVCVDDLRVVDVNAHWEAAGGWRSSSVLHKLIAFSLSREPDRADVCPFLRRVERDNSGCTRVVKVLQYPSSSKKFRQLLAGERDKVDFPWRLYRPDGRLYEAPSTLWLAGREQRRAADGGSIVVTQHYLVISSSWEDAVMVDDALC